MNITVVGAGAMGSIYAGLLADAGNHVSVVDIWQDHIDEISMNGLRIQGASGDRLIRNIFATTNAASIEGCDLAIIATKASSAAAAARSILPALKPDAAVLTIQNGLGSGDRIAKYLSNHTLLLGVAGGFGASLSGPGQVQHAGMELIRIGEFRGGRSEVAEKIARVWRDAGFRVRTYHDINQLVWEKFVCNVAFSGPCTVFNRVLGEIMSDTTTWKIALGCAREAYRVGMARSVNFSFGDVDQYVADFGRKMPDARPSMLQDHLAKRRSEIDFINGMVPVLGAEEKIATPYNEVLSTIIRHREAGFS